MKMRKAFWPVALVLLVITSVRAAKADLVIFGSGFSLPENISLAPMDFGNYGGDYFIPDPGINQLNLGNIDYLPPTGGTAAVFVTLPGGTERPLGGMFLPNNFGSFAGQYLAVGGDANGSFAVAVDANRNITPVASLPGNEFVNPVLAPNGFGSVAGQVLVTSNNGTVSAIDQVGHLSSFASVAGAQLFGSAFAPQGFGSVGGDLLVTDAASGNLFAIDANGNATLFATIPLGPNQPGLRQMAFAPQGFGPYGGDLFLSISGSGAGGGTFGSVVVVDPDGNEIATLIIGNQIDHFDPRGLFFMDDQHLLISSSDPIFLGTPQDFEPVPEPTTLLLVGSGMAGLWLKRWRA
jgi:hypothetical protein